MSRIGKLPIAIPSGVTVTIDEANSLVKVKGPKGQLEQKYDPDIKMSIVDNHVLVTRPTDQKRHRSLHGLYRSLVNNMVIGVSQGYQFKQEVVGVGYKAESQGQILEMSLGFSHSIIFEIPKEVKVDAKTEKRANPIINLESADKQLIGMVAAKIRSLRAPEPYKGKGIKFSGETLRRKAGKAAGSK